MKSIVDRINEAGTESEIRRIINYANWTKPDGAMRRKFLAAAKEKRKKLSAAQHQ